MKTMNPRRNAFAVALCFIALTASLSSHAASDPQGLDFVTALNPHSGSAYKSAMIWYLKGIADQREISEAVSAKMSKPPLADSEWATCRNKLSPEELATKVSEKIIELKLGEEPLAWAVTTAVGATCDSQQDKLLKLRIK
ncbi:MAG: hypothetical protein KJ643_05250 [Gammaproteobacteria bacterium]|nr:hypothetical protein [Gammaproteobacteria bacterium]MBU0840591.1 hypothetical protein [Gammaproteobacteria bacterium]MBU1838283.1 hypothetical protein [Gammaproteobacteria bacterium]